MNRREALRCLASLSAGAALPAWLLRETAMAKESESALLADPDCKLHDPGKWHPEKPARFDAIVEALRKSGHEKALVKVAARAATVEELAYCHTQEYIKTAKSDVESGRRSLSTGDTAVSEKSYEIALKAAGGVMAAVDLVLTGQAKNAFCVVRPPGHHATPSRGMGFCIFNNVALAARYAQKKHQLKKILIADWDVHHGNGTQEAFYSDPTVFFMSTHQDGLYPMGLTGKGHANETGEGEAKGTNMNCPLPAGAGRREILEDSFRKKLVPAAEKFKPELVLISAGFDSREDDPLGRFELTDQDFADLTEVMLGIAKKHGRGRLVSVLEGGYNLEGLASAATAHVKILRQA